MPDKTPTPETALARLGWPLALTHAGLWAERLIRAFWPLWSILLIGAGALVFGLHDMVHVETVWVAGAGLALAALVALIYGARVFRWPTRAEALDRLDRTLPGRPIAALADTQAIGAGDTASVAVWHAHVARMAERVRGAKPARPDMRLSARDPFALRYVALTFFALALLFGSVMRVSSVAQMAPGSGATIAAGPSWEGWIEPPAYTGLPSLYLNDITDEAIRVPQGARLSLRFYGQLGAIGLVDEVTQAPVATDAEPSNAFEGIVAQSGRLELSGPGGRGWNVIMVEDKAPSVILSAEMEVRRGGEMRQPFYAKDDHGIVGGQGQVTLDLAAADRRYGLAADPEPRDPIVFDLPLTISGDRAGFEETIVETFALHPWAGLPVKMQLTVEDALGQTGDSAQAEFILPARRFFDPLANAIAEQRRDILWTRENGRRAAQVIRAVTFLPDGFIKNEKAYLLLRVALRRLEAALDSETGFSVEARDEVAEMLWEAALQFEEGDLSSAKERLERAQERLSEAMRNGATDDEISELMQELREAMQDYMRELAEQGQRDGDQQNADNQNMQEMTSDQLQQMLDRLQQLMEEGRMAEAQQLMEMLRQMMENMQVTQGGPGQQSPGEQAMEDLAETLRDQQGLSDEAFRDLQEQFNPGAQAGQNRQNQGQSGGQGQGAEHDQQGQGQGQGEQGQQGQGQQPGQQQQGADGEQSLAERQGQLRDRLGELQQNLPGTGSEAGDAAREALGRAGEAMDRAEEALRDGDMAEALDNQSEAMEAMREGMRELGNAMAQQQEQNGQQGTANGDPGNNTRDPLGRQAGNQGRLGSDEELTQGDDVYRRARELLDEIRRRSSEQERPVEELEYLKRLLDRF
ncbi:MAG: TIGR02302 family protein [Brevirhabdus sp.]